LSNSASFFSVSILCSNCELKTPLFLEQLSINSDIETMFFGLIGV